MKIDSTGIVSQQGQQLSSNQSAALKDDTKLQPATLKSTVQLPDKVSISQPALEFSVIEQNTKVYQGKEHVILMEESEKTERMDAVLKRLSSDQ